MHLGYAPSGQLWSHRVPLSHHIGHRNPQVGCMLDDALPLLRQAHQDLTVQPRSLASPGGISR